ncbi:rhomboid family intramembrane serine protease [Mucilaginibacter aquariorum]|uniref:Rhomboid family intramembrane serine protease n=1 Tax=Mucilaginibacter aquariorum TaxID=2967225 RepID=A0ABT1T7N9_9SPHI|nr:rhomboid family intramembrane serine protease [Mucilaginibacter aquariorum]MCQ6960644.1 rhomboid family intramembrane serine protease [Mucilaginibacter aquariorum]
MQSPFANMPPVVKNLLIVNIIFYIATFALKSVFSMVGYMSAFYFNSPLFHPWQVITYMFMHDPNSIMHILFNMFALYSFGPMLEYAMGSKKFFNFYFIAGIGGLVLHQLVQGLEVHNAIGSFIMTNENMSAASYDAVMKVKDIYGTPILGASGAIFGVLVGFGMLFPNLEMMIMFIPVPIKAKYIIPVYVVLELFMGVKQFSGDSVAHFAHLGGALFGFLLIKLWGVKRPNNFY